MIKSEDRQQLAQAKLFANVSLESVEHLFESCHRLDLARGEHLLEPGAPNSHLYLILDGELRVYLTDRDLPEHAVFTAGDCVGEMSLLEDKPRIASVKAVNDVVLLEIQKKKFLNLISGNLDTGMKLISSIMSTTLNRLSATNSHLTLLYDIGKIIASSKNLKQMTADAFTNIAKHFKKAENGLIAVYNEFTDELDIHSSINKIEQETIPLTDSFVQKISAKKELIETDNESMIASAFYFEEKFLGFILFAGDQNNSFNINDLILLSSVASLISVSIKNISFISEEEARKRLEETRYKQSF